MVKRKYVSVGVLTLLFGLGHDQMCAQLDKIIGLYECCRRTWTPDLPQSLSRLSESISSAVSV